MIIPQIHSRGESADKLPEADSNISTGHVPYDTWSSGFLNQHFWEHSAKFAQLRELMPISVLMAQGFRQFLVQATLFFRCPFRKFHPS
jgi:hypothetical protein